MSACFFGVPLTLPPLPPSPYARVQWTPGSAGARRTLQAFLTDRMPRFSSDRAKTDRDSTSRLSPHIHFGEVSARQVYQAATCQGLEAAAHGGTAGGRSTAVADFLRQLGFREYSRYLSFHFPFTHERALLAHLRAVSGVGA
jgi:deoxyribodipyrimidine photolyase